MKTLVFVGVGHSNIIAINTLGFNNDSICILNLAAIWT